MNIYTDYSLLDINTITKITESINNDFNLLGKPYNKIEKYVDSNNIFTFNISFLLNKEEKYNLFNQISKDYFWVEFLLERFETTVPLETTATTVKIKKINFDISLNNDTYIKLKDLNGNNFISKIVSVDNNDINFTILELDNDITQFSVDANNKNFFSIVKLVYLDQKGIQFTMVNEDLYKSQIKVKSTVGVIESIDIFPSPILETIDLETTVKNIYIGDRILTRRFSNYAVSSDNYLFALKEGYNIPAKSVEIGNNIFTFSPKSFISGTDVNINIRMMVFNKSNTVEFSEVIFNDFLPFSEVYGEKIETFHVYSNTTNIFLMIRIKNKVLISKLNSSGVLIKNYYFNTNIDNFIRPQYIDGFGNTVDYLLYENQQEEQECFVIENGMPILYKWRFDSQIKYLFNLDNSTYSENIDTSSQKYFKYIKHGEYRFFNVATYLRNNENAMTFLFYSTNIEQNINLKIYMNQTGQVLMDELVYNGISETDSGLIYNSFMSGKINIYEENDIYYISMNGIVNDSTSSNITIKLENLFNIFIGNTITLIKDIKNIYFDIPSAKIIKNNLILNNFSVNNSKEVAYDDLSKYIIINFEKAELNGANRKNFQINFLNENITFEELNPIESAYVQPSNINTGNLTTPYINQALCYTYDADIYEIDNNEILFIIPLMKNAENYTFLYVIFDVNFNILSKLFI